jgi:hypothetical protein
MVIYLSIKVQKKIHFINDCNAKVDYDELEKSILWYSNRPTASIKHIYMFGSYPAVSIHDEKIHIHRILMMYWLGCKIPNEYVVHHIDENKMNALKENLSLVFASTHLSNHNKGKVLTPSQRAIIIVNNHKRKGIKKNKYRKDVSLKQIIDLKSQGLSINKIAQELHCDWTTIRARLQENDNPELLQEVGCG